MNTVTITAAQYCRDINDTKNVCIKATINGVDVFVPLKAGNAEYDEIQRQVEAGDLTIADAD
tara:strand:+ start:490 stop:675 length:186 start_codon:yes stop_codon:yes gene_type:complete